jgi:spermidine/putrescine transport system ATP-binding protein
MRLHRGAADLQLERLSKSFRDIRAVDGVSVSVLRGEFYSLLGPSGCGKTTTLRLIAGFEAADEGRIVLQGTDVTGVPPNQRRVNTVFQHYALFPHMTVQANIAYGLHQKRISRAELADRLDDALRMVRLQDLADRYPRQLSGGQQQRVALARALVNEPAVLLLDEPLAALDLKLRKAMQQELKKLQQRVGITFVYVTHDQEEALTLSDRIAVMNRGLVLQEGTPNEIYERPQTRFVADFIGQTNFFPGVLEQAAPLVVRCAGGLLVRGTAPAELRPGARVVVSVRPEAIAPEAAGHVNSMVGTLARTTYLGDLVQYHIETGAGHEVVMQLQNDPRGLGAGWRIGERVAVGWDQSAALVLAGDGELAGQDDRELNAAITTRRE